MIWSSCQTTYSNTTQHYDTNCVKRPVRFSINGVYNLVLHRPYNWIASNTEPDSGVFRLEDKNKLVLDEMALIITYDLWKFVLQVGQLEKQALIAPWCYTLFTYRYIAFSSRYSLTVSLRSANGLNSLFTWTMFISTLNKQTKCIWHSPSHRATCINQLMMFLNISVWSY